MKLRKSFLRILVITGVLAAQVHGQDWLTNGLVAHYPFNGNANDASGNGRHGSVHGAIPVQDQAFRPASAYRLNGSGDYIYFGRVLPDMPAVTVVAWVKSYGGGVFFGDADWAEANDFTIELGMQSTLVRCDKPPFSTFATVDLGSPVGGVWRHMAWVMTSGGIRVYVDGVLSGASELGGANVGFHNFVIGTLEFPQGNLGWAGYWRGDVSEMRIYNRSLSEDEVGQLYGYDPEPRVALLKAVKPAFGNLSIGTNYQLQISSDMVTWTNHGLPLRATNRNIVYPQYWDVEDWAELYFRLQVSPQP